MSKRTDIEERAEALLLPIVEELHLELVDVEYVKEAGSYYLRAYIDKEGHNRTLAELARIGVKIV